MAWKAKKNFKKKRRVVRRRKAMPSGNKLIMRLPPKTGIAQFRYADQYPITSAIATPAVQTWSYTGMYDTDQIYTGHQPYLYDQFVNSTGANGLFAKYIVLGCKIIIEGVCSSAGTGMYQVGLLATTNPTPTYKTVNELAETQSRKYFKYASYSTLEPKFKITMDVKPWDVLGITKTQYMTDDIYQANYNSNPGKQVFYYLAIQHPNNTTVITGNIVATLIFTAQLFGQNQITPS